MARAVHRDRLGEHRTAASSSHRPSSGSPGWRTSRPGRAEPHRVLVVACVTALACCVTPFGPAVWVYAAGLGANPDVTRRISEWQPTTLRDVQGALFYGSALLVAAFLARRGRVAPWSALLWLGFFFAIGAYAARGIAWWPLAAVAAVVTLYEPVRSSAPAEASRAFRMANAGIAVAIVVACVAALPVWRPVESGTGAPQGRLSFAPPGITAALQKSAGPADRILNPQPWGSWLEFAVPESTVAIDSRLELFPTRGLG